MEWKTFERHGNGGNSKYDGIKTGMFAVAKITDSQKELLLTPPVVNRIGKPRTKILIGGRSKIGFVGTNTGGYKINYGGRIAKEQMGRVCIGSLIKDFPSIRDLDVFEVMSDAGVLYIDTYKPMTLDKASRTVWKNVG